MIVDGRGAGERTIADAQRIGAGRVEDQVAEGGHAADCRHGSCAAAGEDRPGPLAMVTVTVDVLEVTTLPDESSTETFTARSAQCLSGRAGGR